MFQNSFVTDIKHLFVLTTSASVIERYSVTSFQSILNIPVKKTDVFPLVHSAAYIYYGKFLKLEQSRTKSVLQYCCKTAHCPFHVKTEPYGTGEKDLIIKPGVLEHSPLCQSLGVEPINKKDERYFNIRLFNHPVFLKTLRHKPDVSKQELLELLALRGLKVTALTQFYKCVNLAKTRLLREGDNQYLNCSTVFDMLQELNPQMTIALQVDKDSRFFRLFIAPKFPTELIDTGLFRVGIIDGAHATYSSSNYDGVYLSFHFKTTSGESLPIAFCACPTESCNNTSWMIQMMLKANIPVHTFPIMTDRGNLLSCAAALKRVLEIELSLKYCLEHLIRNVIVHAGGPTVLPRNSIEYRSLRKAMERLYDCASGVDYKMALEQIISAVAQANKADEHLSYGRSMKVLCLLLEINVRHISIYGNMPSFDAHAWEQTIQHMWNKHAGENFICTKSNVPHGKPFPSFGVKRTNIAEAENAADNLNSIRSSTPPVAALLFVHKYNTRVKKLSKQVMKIYESKQKNLYNSVGANIVTEAYIQSDLMDIVSVTLSPHHTVVVEVFDKKNQKNVVCTLHRNVASCSCSMSFNFDSICGHVVLGLKYLGNVCSEYRRHHKKQSRFDKDTQILCEFIKDWNLDLATYVHPRYKLDTFCICFAKDAYLKKVILPTTAMLKEKVKTPVKARICYPPPLYRSTHTSSRKRIVSKGEGNGASNSRAQLNFKDKKKFKAAHLKLSGTSMLVASSPHTPGRLRLFSTAEKKGVFSPKNPIHGSQEASNIITELRNSLLFRSTDRFCSICQDPDHDIRNCPEKGIHGVQYIEPSTIVAGDYLCFNTPFNKGNEKPMDIYPNSARRHKGILFEELALKDLMIDFVNEKVTDTEDNCQQIKSTMGQNSEKHMPHRSVNTTEEIVMNHSVGCINTNEELQVFKSNNTVGWSEIDVACPSTNDDTQDASVHSLEHDAKPEELSMAQLKNRLPLLKWGVSNFQGKILIKNTCAIDAFLFGFLASDSIHECVFGNNSDKLCEAITMCGNDTLRHNMNHARILLYSGSERTQILKDKNDHILIVKATSVGTGQSAMLRNLMSPLDGYCAISDIFKAHHPTTKHTLVRKCVQCGIEQTFDCQGQLIFSISDNTTFIPSPTFCLNAIFECGIQNDATRNHFLGTDRYFCTCATAGRQKVIHKYKVGHKSFSNSTKFITLWYNRKHNPTSDSEMYTQRSIKGGVGSEFYFSLVFIVLKNDGHYRVMCPFGETSWIGHDGQGFSSRTNEVVGTTLIKDTTVAVATEDTRKSRMFLGGVRENFKITHLVYKIVPVSSMRQRNGDHFTWKNSAIGLDHEVFGHLTDVIVMYGESSVVRSEENDVSYINEISITEKNEPTKADATVNELYEKTSHNSEADNIELKLPCDGGDSDASISSSSTDEGISWMHYRSLPPLEIKAGDIVEVKNHMEPPLPAQISEITCATELECDENKYDKFENDDDSKESFEKHPTVRHWNTFPLIHEYSQIKLIGRMVKSKEGVEFIKPGKETRGLTEFTDIKFIPGHITEKYKVKGSEKNWFKDLKEVVNGQKRNWSDLEKQAIRKSFG